MSSEQTEEGTQCTIKTESTSARIEVVSANMDDSSLARNSGDINHQMLTVPGSHDGAFGSNGSSKSRSSSVVSSISAAEPMESDGDSPPEGLEVAFAFDAKSPEATTQSIRPTNGERERLVRPEKLINPSDDDGRSLSEVSSCITDTDDDLLSDEVSSNPTDRKFGKRQRSWGLLRHMVFWSPFVQDYRRSYPWVQLAGHEGSFKPGEAGTILKRESAKERECLHRLMKDVLKPYVPEFFGQVSQNGEMYVRMQDLLADFVNPAVMDIKMGVRTYMEDELLKARTRPGYRTDLYEKMLKIDPSAPTYEERQQQAVTKARYMQWRETITTTAKYGYRIEALKLPGKNPHIREFKNMKDPADVSHWLAIFHGDNPDVQATILARLRDVRTALETSPFFRTHELIGSSLLFVRDEDDHTGIWMIDFGKTTMVPPNHSLDHRSPWVEGNHEDGYLWGLDNLIDLWESIR